MGTGFGASQTCVRGLTFHARKRVSAFGMYIPGGGAEVKLEEWSAAEPEMDIGDGVGRNCGLRRKRGGACEVGRRMLVLVLGALRELERVF